MVKSRKRKGTRRHGSKRKRKGGNLMQMLHKALVPFSLVFAKKHASKKRSGGGRKTRRKHRKGRKTYKRRH